jgi:protein SCO1/2
MNISKREPEIPILVFASLIAFGAAPALAQSPASELIRKVAFDQNLNAQVPLELPFRDEAGREVRLGDFLGKKLVILTLVYYECPMLCTLELNSLARSLKPLAFDVGDQFDIVTVSIDPGETPQLAAIKKKNYLGRYGRKGAERGWHFLTGDEMSIRRLAGVVGFRYVYDPKTDQYAHPAGIMILTPQGKIARYLYGVDYAARDLRLGLIEASAGKIGSPVDQLLLLCFHYDPSTGKYNFAIMQALRVCGVATVAGLGTYVFVMLRRERRRGAAVAEV